MPYIHYYQHKYKAQMKKQLTSVFYSVLILFSFVSRAFAVTTPSFPSCANPQGSLKVSYSEGTHGIVGSMDTYTGKDAVYTLTEETTTQCFCSKDGAGIQTNWWVASSLTEDEISILKNQDWIYVPNGNLWGLRNDPYLAKNINYSCLPGENDNNNKNNSQNSSSDDGIGGGDVLGESGDILGLAATGNSFQVYLAFILGIGLTTLGIYRFKHSK